jgi:hypothetical protein
MKQFDEMLFSVLFAFFVIVLICTAITLLSFAIDGR